MYFASTYFASTDHIGFQSRFVSSGGGRNGLPSARL
jgi:hypothetical protein